jgi:hypothetical protein
MMSKNDNPCPQYRTGWDYRNDTCKECQTFFENEFEECRLQTTGYTKWHHKVDTKAGIIDLYIIEGKHTVGEIELAVAMELGKCRKYSVREHLSHLRRQHGVNADVDVDKCVKIIKEG